MEIRRKTGFHVVLSSVIIVILFANICLSFANTENPVRAGSNINSQSKVLFNNDVIIIHNDSAFVSYGFEGTGLSDDPYLIKDMSISTNDLFGIQINDTTKHFEIRNCTLASGIQVLRVADNTVRIINNTLTKGGISVSFTNGPIISNNSLLNTQGSIYVYVGDSASITDNYFYNCTGAVGITHSHYSNITGNYYFHEADSIPYFSGGINVGSSEFCRVINNTCINSNGDGISLAFASNSTVQDNIVIGHDHGFHFGWSDDVLVSDNLSQNNTYGMLIVNYCFRDIITKNVFLENDMQGLYIAESFESVIHHNNFTDNNGGTLQVADYGENNTWFEEESKEGNYYSDWTGEGSYIIKGTAHTEDPYPLDEFGNPYRPVSSEEEASYLAIHLILIFLNLIVIQRRKRKKNIK